MRIGFRVDGSNSIGSGHLMRCIVLAKEFQKRNLEIEFICYKSLNNLNFIPLENSFKTTEFAFESPWNVELDSKWLIENYEKNYFDVLVIDHYSLGIYWEKRARHIAKKIFVIDDLANREHDCDYLLDQNLYNNIEIRYNNLIPPPAIKFLGPRYVLLRNEFLCAVNKVRIREDGLKNLLICFGGGSDSSGGTIKTLNALIDGNFNFENIDIVVSKSFEHSKQAVELSNKIKNCTLYTDVKNISELMLKADLYIGASGSTTWEKCFLALPSLVIIIADNQNEIANHLYKLGAIINLGKNEEVTKDNIVVALKQMSQEKLKSLSEKSNAILNINNFLGAQFICDSIIKKFIEEGLYQKKYNLLPLSERYLDILLSWRNSDAVRLNMFNSQKINIEEHYNWFKKISSENKSSHSIFLYHNIPVGYVSFSKYKHEDNSAHWGFYLGDTSLQLKGLSHLMCFVALENFFEEDCFNTLHAEVLLSNIKSHRLHKTLGFQMVSEDCKNDENQVFTKYIYKKSLWDQNKNDLRNKLKNLFGKVFQ